MATMTLANKSSYYSKTVGSITYTNTNGTLTITAFTAWNTGSYTTYDATTATKTIKVEVVGSNSATASALKSVSHTTSTIYFKANSVKTTYTLSTPLVYTPGTGKTVYPRITFSGTNVADLKASTLMPSSSSISVATANYTVSYSANGGSGAPRSQTKKHGTTLTLSSTKPTRTGYTFSKWNTNSSGTGTNYSSGGSYSTNAALSLYAVWTKLTYTVSFNANGGSGAPSSQTKTYGTTLTLSSTKPTRTGYTFKGWGTSSSTSTVSYSAGGSYTSNAAITLYAIWSINTYTISFNANGGSGVPSSQTKTYGTTLTLSSTKPTRTGYTFSKWNTNSSGTGTSYSSGGSYTGNTAATLYAIWNINTYTVSYNANGGSGAPSSQTKTYGTTLTLSSTKPTREGYDFKGWSTTSEGVVQYPNEGSYTTNAATTLYAIWEEIIYKITYNANGGTGAPTDQEKPYALESITLREETPTRVGYTFSGWGSSSTAIAASYQAGSVYNMKESIDLYAIWKPLVYSIVYDVNGGVGGPTSVQFKTHDVPTLFSELVPTRVGYNFLGWSLTQNGAVVGQPGETYTIEGDATLYGQWEIKTYSITYLSIAGGTLPTNQTKIYDIEITLSEEIPYLEGKSFTIWGTKEDGTGDNYFPGATINKNEDLTLYALWDLAWYEISYDANGGEKAPTGHLKLQGASIVLSIEKPVLEGYRLLGWDPDKDTLSPRYNIGDTFNEDADTVLYAIWADATGNLKWSISKGEAIEKIYLLKEEECEKPRLAIKAGTEIGYVHLLDYTLPGKALCIKSGVQAYKISFD